MHQRVNYIYISLAESLAGYQYSLMLSRHTIMLNSLTNSRLVATDQQKDRNLDGNEIISSCKHTAKTSPGVWMPLSVCGNK